MTFNPCQVQILRFLYKSCYYSPMIRKNFNDPELQAHIDGLHKDEMAVFVMADGLFRGALFHGTRFVNQMRAQHNLGILETMVLGQASLCGALMIPTMKGREHLTFRYDTNGPAAGFSVEADSTGYVRGYLLQNPIPISSPLENWDLAPFFGPGTLSVSRFPEGAKEPQTGTVEIQHKNIAKDLTWYFQQSEQIHSAFNTSIKFDTKGRVIGAGGLFLQSMPTFGGTKAQGSEEAQKASGVEEELILRAEAAFNAAPSFGDWFSEKGDLEDIIFGLFREFNPSIALLRDIRFDCPCSKEHYLQAIRGMNPSELKDIKENGPDPLEIICHNCGSVYHLPTAEI